MYWLLKENKNNKKLENFEVPKDVTNKIDNREIIAQMEKIISDYDKKCEESLNKRNIIEDLVYVIDSDTKSQSEDGISIGDSVRSALWIHIHISDISSFISKNSPLDTQASDRIVNSYGPMNRKTIFPYLISNFFSFNNKRKSKYFSAITFSALVDKDGTILNQKISPSFILSDKIRRISFDEYNFLLENKENQAILIFDEYYKLLQEKRASVVSDISYFIDKSLTKKVNEFCPASRFVREMMLLSGFIAGNCVNNLSIPFIFRENIGPILKTHIESIPTWELKKAIVHRNSGIPVLENPNRIFYRNFADVSSPIRKYIHFLNQKQLINILYDHTLFSSSYISDILEKSRRNMININQKESASYRKQSLSDLNRDVGENGIVVGRIFCVDNHVVSGRKSIMVSIKLTEYPKLQVTMKLNYSKFKSGPPKDGDTFQFRVEKIDVSKDILELSVLKTK